MRAHVPVPETGRLRAMHGASGTLFKALRVAARMAPAPDLMVASGNTEGVTETERLRAEGVVVAGEALPTLVAEHRRESEALVAAGFVAANDEWRQRLTAVTRSRGLDPTDNPHRLLAGDAHNPRDANRVCKALLGVDHVTPASERARACWLDTPIAVLDARGEATGLRAYLLAVEAIVLSLLGDDRP